jgi:DNA-binding CsgD family transcriptional regulator/PAS domain-containing protein
MTREEITTDALIEAIYDGTVETPGWATFLGAATGLFGVTAASILIETQSLGHPERLRLFSPGVEPAMQDEIDRFSSTVVFSNGHDERIADLTAPFCIPAKALSFSARIAPGIAFAFGLWGGGGFSSEQRKLLEMLAPHLKRALRIFVNYAQAYRERAVYQTVIDRIGIGVALVDPKGIVMATNEVGQEIFKAGDGLTVSNGRLIARDPATARSLESFIHAGAEAQTDPVHAHGQPLAVMRENNPAPLTVIVHPGPSVQPVNAPLRRSAIVVMRDPERRASVSAHVVGQLFGLTPAEATLATLLAQGADLDEAATELGIRRNTARSQLQSIFMKTNAKRQSELVRMILSSVATLSH